MAKKEVPKPIYFQIRPANRGINVAVAPQRIDMRETPKSENIRLNKSLLEFRNGFSVKYKGASEAIRWIDAAYSNGTSVVVGFGEDGAWRVEGDTLRKIDVFDGAGAEIDYPVFTASLIDHQMHVDMGEGKYDFADANGGAIFPGAGANDYGDLMVMVNGTGNGGTNGLFIFAYTGVGSVVEGEVVSGLTDAPTEGRAIAIFDNRVVVGGTEDNQSDVRWSAKGRFDWWDQSGAGGYTDAGSEILGESPDWIQAMKRLGDYLVIYKERSMWLGRKSMIDDPAIRFEPVPGQGIGLAAPNSIGDLGEEQLFLGWDDVYSYSLKKLVPVGTRIKQELFYGDLGIVPEYIGCCVGMIAEEYDEYWLFIPTGRWPEVTNVLDNPTFRRSVVVGNLASGSPIVTVVTTADLAKLAAPDAVSGSGIPASTVVSGEAAAQFTMDQNATSTIVRGRVYVDELLNWSEDTDAGTYVAGPVVETGPFGDGTVCELSRTDGTYVGVISDKKDYGEVIDEWIFSCTVWVMAETDKPIELDLSMVTYDGGGINDTDQGEITVTVPGDGVWYPIIYSTTIADADGEQIALRIRNTTVDDKLFVCGAQLVDLTTLVAEEGDPGFLYEATNGVAPAYKNIDDTPTLIPLIIGAIGPWLPDTAWVYNYEENAWTCWRLPMTGFGYDSLATTITIADLEGTIAEQNWRFDEKRLSAFAPTNLIAQPDGNIYEIAATYGADWMGVNSTPFLAYWESKDFDLDRPIMDKTFSRLFIFHEVSHGPITVTVGVSTDSGETWTEQDVVIRTGYTVTFADFFVTGNQMRFKVKGTNPGFHLVGFAVKLIPRGEANAYG